MNEITTSAAYNRALAEHTRASGVFRKVQDDYRAGRCGDDEYLEARRLFAAATAVYDAAFALEAAEGQIREARQMASDLHAAQTLEDLDRLYVAWIGYSMVADDPQVELEQVNDILQGWLREHLQSIGVDWIDAHAEPEHA